MDFDSAYIERNKSVDFMKSDEQTIFKCWFGGMVKNLNIEERFRHYITFSKECFSQNAEQQNISIFFDPRTSLPEWKAIATDLDGSDVEDSLPFYLNLSFVGSEESGSKLGGKPYFIRGAQAGLLQPTLEEQGLEFLLQLDDEDFFPAQVSGIDKDIRDVLCGGAIYIFAKIDRREHLITLNNSCIDHQM